MDNMKLRIECTVFFERNPFAFETLASLSMRLGRSETVLEPVLNELTSFSILEKLGDGKNSIYKYVQPTQLRIEQ